MNRLSKPHFSNREVGFCVYDICISIVVVIGCDTGICISLNGSSIHKCKFLPIFLGRIIIVVRVRRKTDNAQKNME